jgi:hypothetical protein
VALPADAAALPLETNNVYLNSLDTTTDKGIGYLRAVYVGSSLDQRRNVSIKESQRSFSGTGSGSRRLIEPGFSGSVFLGPFRFTVTFDYPSESFTVTWSSISNSSTPRLTPRIKNIRNRNTNIPPAANNITVSVGSSYKVDVIADLSITPVGPVKRYALTATAQAVQL